MMKKMTMMTDGGDVVERFLKKKMRRNNRGIHELPCTLEVYEGYGKAKISKGKYYLSV